MKEHRLGAFSNIQKSVTDEMKLTPLQQIQLAPEDFANHWCLQTPEFPRRHIENNLYIVQIEYI